MASQQGRYSNRRGSTGKQLKYWLIGVLSIYACAVAHAELSQSKEVGAESREEGFTERSKPRRWQRRPRPQVRPTPQPPPPQQQQPVYNSYVVLGYNDLGMHCMNQDFSQLCILPPFNSLHAQVIRRGVEPDIISSGSNTSVSYVVPNNTTSVTKTNFWQYAPALFGAALPADVGLTGNGLSGEHDAHGQQRLGGDGHTDYADQRRRDPERLPVGEYRG